VTLDEANKLVSRLSDPAVATAWTCGLSATALVWLMRLARHSPILMCGHVQGAGHCWVQCEDRWFDPTIEQFGKYPISGQLPHPLAVNSWAAERPKDIAEG